MFPEAGLLTIVCGVHSFHHRAMTVEHSETVSDNKVWLRVKPEYNGVLASSAP